MNRKQILDKLLSKKGKDYSYTIAFFLIFSFFTFFVIRPNILAVFQANLKIESLKKTNALYESQIQNVIDAQSQLVETRDDLWLLDEAITQKPEVNGLIRDISDTAGQDNLEINKTNLVDVYLKDVTRTEELKTITFKVGGSGEFEDYFNLTKKLYNQRRLKLLKNIDIGRAIVEATPSSELTISFDLEGYYL